MCSGQYTEEETVEIADPRVNPSLVPEGSRAVVIAEHQQDIYRALPSVRTPKGQVVTRWKLTDEERAAIFLRGADVFVTILSSGPINPLFVTVGPIDWNETEP